MIWIKNNLNLDKKTCRYQNLKVGYMTAEGYLEIDPAERLKLEQKVSSRTKSFI